MVRFERRLKHPVEKVWAAITQPSKLVEWLADADIEYTPGGKIQLRFGNTGSVMNGTVTHFEPQRLFAYLWNSEDAAATAVRWELQPEPDGCLLVLTHTFSTPDTLPSMMAGWHTHLEMMDPALGGRPVAWPWSRWEELRDKYARELE